MSDPFGGFVFMLGEIVKHKVNGARLCVLSRILEEWPGGTARAYICRGPSEEIGPYTLYEHELLGLDDA